MESVNQIGRLKNELKNGYRVQRVFGRLRKIPTSSNRREMLKKRIAAAEKQLPRWLWKSVEPVHRWDAENKEHVFSHMRYVRGTYRSAAMLSACVAPAAGCGIGAVSTSTGLKAEI